MQRHKKYLIITIWISTIAFVGAGFVGWGQYSYGDKAGAVAKVGNIEITMGELQKSYSNIYAQYSKMFQGDFDEEKAKSFGLKDQALKHLTQQALVLNLAKAYDLEVSDAELLAEIKSQEYFFKDGVFNKEVYRSILARNNLSLKEYEADVKKELLIKKTLNLLPVEANEPELNIVDAVSNIADKINYKVLRVDDISVDTSDEMLKPFWEKKQQNFMSEVSYDVKYIEQAKIDKKYDDAELTAYYNDNKTHFKDSEGKILTFEAAKEKVIQELNDKETKKEALRSYIAYKKGKLENAEIKTATISASNNPFGSEVLENVSKLTAVSPFLKPLLVNGVYLTFELVKTNQSVPKTYVQAKEEVLPMYVDQQKRAKITELAKSSVASFIGETTDYITGGDADKLTNISTADANEFLAALFTTQKKRGYVSLESGNIVMYNILEQKLLNKTNTNEDNAIVKVKSAMFNEGLVKKLQNKYKTEIFIQGL